jgi:hypothetical protein
METKKSTVLLKERLENLLRTHEFQYEKIAHLVVDALPFAKSKFRPHLIPRQALMVYMRFCGMGPSEVARVFGKHHSAVINTFKIYDKEVFSGFGPVIEEFIKLVEEAHAFIPLQNLDDVGLLEYCSLAQLDTYFFRGEQVSQETARPLKNMVLNVIVLCKDVYDFHSYTSVYKSPNKRYYKLGRFADIKESFFKYDDIVRTTVFDEEKFDRPKLLQVFLEEFRENKKKWR